MSANSPSEQYAESASCSAAPGMPSEEMIARWLCGHEGHTPEQVEALWTEWLDNARELLGMFGPYFEAKEREIERLTNNRDMWKGQCDRQAETIRQLRRSYDLKCSDLEAAEANLAQVVEALRPFAWPPLYVFDKDQAFVPMTMPKDWIGGGYFTTDDFRRARAASNIGQNEGEKG